VITGKAGGYTGSPGDAPDLDFSIVQAMEQPGWGSNPSAPWAQALMLCIPKDSPDEEKQGAYDFLRYFTNAENQAAFSIMTGYGPANKRVTNVADYQTYMSENQAAGVLLSQSEHASIYPVDPTGGAILDALNIAAEKVDVDGVSAQEALDEAQKVAQEALDEALGQ
ncbi:MAG: extracellular solute-binding protein, partial [Oscillospiraceae bacterium]|nr:extracellular solute-binding protein [Oscillospiraceae bacterium]